MNESKDLIILEKETSVLRWREIHLLLEILNQESRIHILLHHCSMGRSDEDSSPAAESHPKPVR